MPLEAEEEAPPTAPYRNSMTLVVSYIHTCMVLLAGPVVARGMVTNYWTFRIRLGALPVTTYVTLPVVPVARSSQ